MSLIRLYADAEGETHFADVEPRFAPPADTWWSVTAEHTEPMAAESVFLRRLRSDGGNLEPHTAPRRQLIIGLDGECEVEVSDGEVRRIGPGTVALVEDVAGKGHWTRIIGDAEVRVVVVTLAPDHS